MSHAVVKKENNHKHTGIIPNRSLSAVVREKTEQLDLPFIQRKSSCACGGTCPNCQTGQRVQTKLKIGAPNDIYEQEAERVADQVMRMPDQLIQRQELPEKEMEDGEDLVQTKPLTTTITQRVQREEVENVGDDELFQEKSTGETAPGMSSSTASRIQSFKGGGHPLPKLTRGFFESRIGADFSEVRVHNDTRAADAAKSVNARAFTLGNDVVFGEGEYTPETYSGKKLIAHELTHTIQQSGVQNTLCRTPGAPAPATPAAPVNSTSGPMSRAEFDRRMMSEYGVTTIRTGTYADQNASVSGTIPVATWASWSPADPSEVYRFILNAFDEFATTFNGVPNVTDIVFYQVYYDSNAGSPVPDQDVGASYGAGQLAIYDNTTSTARMGLPHARSNTSGTYTGAPILTQSGTGSSPGAPVGYTSMEQSVKRVIWHELGHGLAETASNACGTAAAPDPSMLTDYAAAVGWLAGKLYDIGNATVAADLAAGRTPAANMEITEASWNHPQWNEQPVSGYMVSGGYGEDYAEAVRTFVENPALLLARSPARHAFISTRVATLSPCLRQVSSASSPATPGTSTTTPSPIPASNPGQGVPPTSTPGSSSVPSPNLTPSLPPGPGTPGSLSALSFPLLSPNPDLINWLPIRGELNARGAPFDDVMQSSIVSLWMNNYSFLNGVIGLSDENAAFWTNRTIPLAVGAGLNRDYPTMVEQMDRELNTSSINIPVSDIVLYLINR